MSDKNPSAVSECFRDFLNGFLNIRVNDKKAAMADADMQKAIQEVSDTLGDSGRVLVRHSDTESLIRIMVEAQSSEDCKLYADRIAEVLYRKGYAAQ